MTQENMENRDSETNDSAGDDTETTSTESTDTDTEDDTDTSDDAVAIANKKFEDQRKRAEKAENDLKVLKKKLQDAEKTTSKTSTSKDDSSGSSTTDQLTREEAILIAKGFSDEKIAYAKKVAAVEGGNILVAVESDLFKTWDATQEAKAKESGSELGASRGSTKVKKPESFNTPGLATRNPEKHKELWRQSLGR